MTSRQARAEQDVREFTRACVRSGLLPATLRLFRSSGLALRAPDAHPAGRYRVPGKLHRQRNVPRRAGRQGAQQDDHCGHGGGAAHQHPARKPSGPGAEIAIVTLASTRARSSGGAAVVIAAKNRG